MTDKVIIYTDGGCRHNPGPASIGVVIQDEQGRTLERISRYLGESTNNQAEYNAVIAGLQKAAEMGTRKVEVRSDSQLIVEQANGRYRVKDPELQVLLKKVQETRRLFERVDINYIPREQNREADRLACEALKSPGNPVPDIEFSVRRATARDIEGMNGVWAEVEEQHAAALPNLFRLVENPTRNRRYVSSILSDNDYAIFIAEHGGRTIGLIQVGLQEAPNLPYMMPRRYAKISDLVVAKEFQHGGVGSALIEQAEEWARSRRAASIELNVYEFNSGARDFYLHRGYRTGSRMMWKDF
jgi:ribonuclease HI